MSNDYVWFVVFCLIGLIATVHRRSVSALQPVADTMLLRLSIPSQTTMKTKQTAALLMGLVMILIGGCDAVGTNSDSVAKMDLDYAPLYGASSPSLVVFPLRPDSTVFYTAAGDTSGME